MALTLLQYLVVRRAILIHDEIRYGIRLGRHFHGQQTTQEYSLRLASRRLATAKLAPDAARISRRHPDLAIHWSRFNIARLRAPDGISWGIVEGCFPPTVAPRNSVLYLPCRQTKFNKLMLGPSP